MTSPTTHIRINKKTYAKIKTLLPNVSDCNRIETLFDLSYVNPINRNLMGVLKMEKRYNKNVRR